MTNENMGLCIYLVLNGLFVVWFIFWYSLAFKSSQSLYCGGCNGNSACLHCLCSDFINFPWPFKTFKFQTSRPKGSLAATLQWQCL